DIPKSSAPKQERAKADRDFSGFGPLDTRAALRGFFAAGGLIGGARGDRQLASGPLLGRSGAGTPAGSPIRAASASPVPSVLRPCPAVRRETSLSRGNAGFQTARRPSPSTSR